METFKNIGRTFSQLIKIEWAPLHVPLRRRMQTLAAGVYVFIFLCLPYISVCLTVYGLVFLNTIGRSLLLFYLGYAYYYQKKSTASNGGRGCMSLRTSGATKYLREYFPIELVKTAELKPDRNYLIAIFPHGILGIGFLANMGHSITKWLELFPGIRPKIGSINLYFYIPIIRELMISFGCISCSKETLLQHLKTPIDSTHKENKDGFTSNAVALAVGGWSEALDARPGNNVLTLRKRKGFVKIAIQAGSSIVPSFSFGEVDTFDQVTNSWCRRIQTIVQRLTGFAPALPIGRGFFQYSYGLLPHRHRIVQILGTPIEIKQMDEPDSAYVNEIHQKVIDQLIEMFEKYKFKYMEHPEKAHLVIN